MGQVCQWETQRARLRAERCAGSAERVAGEWARVKKRESARRLLVDLRRQVGPKGVVGSKLKRAGGGSLQAGPGEESVGAVRSGIGAARGR